MAIGEIFGVPGPIPRRSHYDKWVLHSSDRRIKRQGRLSVASVLSMLSEVVRKLVGAGLFAKIRLTNGRLAEYYDSLVVCVSEEVPAIFRYSKGRTDSQSREYV